MDDHTLMAYVDGELDAAQVQEVEAELATEPEVRQRVRAFRDSSTLARSAFNDIVREPVPSRLTEALSASAAGGAAPGLTPAVLGGIGGTQTFYALAASFALLAVGFGAGSYLTQMRGDWRARVSVATAEAGPALSPALLPRYAVGETFSFSDGRRETVIGVAGEKITWRDHSDATLIRYSNFLIPPLSWETRARQSKAETNAEPKLLWPLVVGKDEDFEFRQIIDRKNGGIPPAEKRVGEWNRTWRCTVDQTEIVKVAAGIFDTYRVSCFRYRLDTGEWRQTRTYYYAPEVGHYILREDKFASRPSRRIELVSYGFDSTVMPKADQISLNETLQETMNRNADGVSTEWTSADGFLTATLTPIRTYRDKSGFECRKYTSTYELRGRSRTNVRWVCPYSNGRWQRVR